jgi:hypothetical protein
VYGRPGQGELRQPPPAVTFTPVVGGSGWWAPCV